jgi:hypothetical protein
VRIENRGAAEAVPVSLEAVASGSALPVQVVGVPQVAMGSVIQARASRQQWEYQSLSIAPGVDLALALNTAGMEGWETTGVAFASSQGNVILVKRPR